MNDCFNIESCKTLFTFEVLKIYKYYSFDVTSRGIVWHSALGKLHALEIYNDNEADEELTEEEEEEAGN